MSKACRVFKNCLIALILSWALQAVGDEQDALPDKIRLTNGEWPPFQSQLSPHYGMISHAVTRAFALAGIQVDYGFFPWKRARMVPLTGGWDGTLVWTYNEELAKDYFFSDSVLETPDHFLSLKAKGIVFNNWDSIKPYRIGVTNGYYYGSEFQQLQDRQQLRIINNLTDEDNIHKLIQDKIDIFIVNKFVGLYLVRRLYPNKVQEFKLSEQSTRIAELHVLFAKINPNAHKMVKLFNEKFSQLKTSGEYETMLKAINKGAYDPLLP